MKVHQLRKWQGSPAGEISKVVRKTLQDVQAKGLRPLPSYALLRSLLARQSAKGVHP